jgi:hypothetical protein
MALLSGFLFASYLMIVFLAGFKVIGYYTVRQLVKANFWLNLAIFALMAFLTLIILIELFFE